jgi:hypothetical protein
MEKTWLRGLVPAVVCTASLAAQAQTPPTTVRRDPLDATASVPAPVYRSSLVPTPASDAESPISWQEANQSVARIGGWRSYARQAQEHVPARTAPPPAASVSTTDRMAKPMGEPMPMPPGHSGPKTP